MHIRFLEYFVALSRDKHFARAAEACHVSQPTLSAGIAALEEALGKRLVIRDRRFIDLTPEGHGVLDHAKRLLADLQALRASLEIPDGPLRGELRIGAIPAAMPSLGYLVAAILKAHPMLNIAVRSMTSRDIERALLAYELDAGLTYLDNEPPAQVRSVPLYSERYLFVTRTDSSLDRQQIDWEGIAGAPLCLLHTGMQNRRILDAHIAAKGLKLSPVATADSYVALLSMVSHGGLSTVITDSHAEFIAGAANLKVLEISDPAPPNLIGLIIVDRELPSPLASAAFHIAGTLTLR